MVELPIRGDKSQLRILRDGEQIAWTHLTNITESETSQYIEHHLIGHKKPLVDVLMMGFEGQINGLVVNPEIDRLIQEIRDARKAGVALPEINIVYTEKYQDGRIQTFLFTDVQIMLANRTGGGENEPITKAISFKASDKRLL